MSLVLPHVDGAMGAKAATKAPKAGAVPTPSGSRTFQDQWKAQVAHRAHASPEKAVPERSAADKLKHAAAEAPKVATKASSTETAAHKTPVKAEPRPEARKRELPTEHEISAAAALVTALTAPPPPTSTVKQPKVDVATEALATDKTKPTKVAPKPAAEKSEGQTPVADAPRWDAVSKTEAKKVDKDAPKVTVVDRRTDRDRARRAEQDEAAQAQPVQAQGAVFKPTTEPKPVGEVQVVFQSVSGKTNEKFDVPAKNAPVSPQDAAAFQKFLVEKGYGQLVEQARIILKNDNAGEIRMTLYPETLGKIKVALNLNDNHLAGEIFVENQTVKEILQDNMGQMLQSFRDGGFGSLNIQVSVGNGQQGEARDSGERPGIQSVSYGRNVAATRASDGAAPVSRIANWTDRQVNLTA